MAGNESKHDWTVYSVEGVVMRCADCGGEPVLAYATFDERRSFPDRQHYHVHCESGLCSTHAFGYSAREALGKWTAEQERKPCAA